MKMRDGGINRWNVLRLLHVPSDAENAVPYSDRGWPFFESQVSLAWGPYVTNVPDAQHTPDPVPMHPDEFDKLIPDKVFASPKADRPQVARLYRKVFC